MAHVIETFAQLPSMFSASHAITLVSVPWSPWPHHSRQMLAELESTQDLWAPDPSIAFFDLWPEREDELNQWYDAQCARETRFELHGHGYGPFWWLANGTILDCLTKPYDYSLTQMQKRSAEVFQRSD